MKSTKSRVLAGLILASLVLVPLGLAQTSQPMTPTQKRNKADQDFKKGNWKFALEGYRALALDAADDPMEVSKDLTQAIACLARLGSINEFDDLVEGVVKAHGSNWRLLETAADSYVHSSGNYGYIVAGQFIRGDHRGGTAKQVYTYERDRVRAMQLMQQAMEQLGAEKDKAAASGFYERCAEFLLGNRSYGGAWRLQYLTDLTTLPDYDEGYYDYYYRYQGKGAPVDENGQPVFHTVPKSWKDAASDGQRWRWCLTQAMELDEKSVPRVLFTFAGFLRQQFDVQTMAYYGRGWGGGEDDSGGGGGGEDKKDQTGPFAVKTLGQDETIARLAAGVQRFKLPEEFNFIHIFQAIAAMPKGDYAPQALEMLGQIFEDRQQYITAAKYWQQVIDEYGPGQESYRRHRLDQIVANWGRFEPMMTQPAGQSPTVDYRFRNGDHVSFEAFEIKQDKLLEDVKAYIKSKPNNLDWQQLDPGNIGWRLVEKDQRQYLGDRVAQWDLDLKPRADHFDRRITVHTPDTLKKAGAYLLSAKMKDGNTSRIILWVADTVLVKKSAANSMQYCFVADAVTGAPVPKANVEFFGYRQKWLGNGNKYQIDTQDFAEFTDPDGQVLRKTVKGDAEYSWLITATTPEGRLAYVGFSNFWWNEDAYDQQYKQTKAYAITDRPVYRPLQTVKFKYWIGQAQYDQTGKSPFAGKAYTVEVRDPKGEKFWEKTLTADEFGGFDGEVALPKEVTLGVYYLVLKQDKLNLSGQTFRIEEYKKPEYEVKIDAPTEPVMLGDHVSATISARYYFGAPVSEAKVSYKITRTSHDARWYPVAPWDWFYDRGYWWFAEDYQWYPGWRDWGCERPSPWWWWGWRGQERPEIVAEAQAPIGADGTLKVQIDTSLAKAMHGDEDHAYTITAEVTDASRRVIVGTGQVLVARKPFKVYAWVDRGYYRVGDVVQASFCAHTLDDKPVKGKGILKLYSVTYDKAMKPVEAEVQKWDLDTDDQGQAQQTIKAAKAGQYRLSYQVTDAKGRSIEGGYVFTVTGEGFADGASFRFNDIELIADKREYQPGDTVKVQVNANRAGATVLLFVRPSNGIYLPPKVLRLQGKSTIEEVAVVQKDMPNFFLEALTIGDSKVYEQTREIVVPPESRVLNVEVKPSAATFKPGEKAKFTIRLTDPTGAPFVGNTVVSLYDKAVEYISGGPNVPEIKAFFWKWRRQHRPSTESSVSRYSGQLLKPKEIGMGDLGVFGAQEVDEMKTTEGADASGGKGGGEAWGKDRLQFGAAKGMEWEEFAAPAAPSSGNGHGLLRDGEDKVDALAAGLGETPGAIPGAGTPGVQPSVRSNFADTALWVANLNTDANGQAEVEVAMPENLTTWKARVWAMGAGTRVGEGSAEVVTTKNLLVRLQAPRFFVEKDEVVLSANVHNYLKTKKKVEVRLEIPMALLMPTGDVDIKSSDGIARLGQIVEIDAGGQKRVDWRVRVIHEGQVSITMKALTDEESDAMEMSFPVYVHGMLKTESFSGVIRPDKDSAAASFKVPEQRRPDQTRLEVRYSPTLAGAMVDALPYLVDYPYGCTEQTLNRFLPTVITQHVLLKMNLDLKAIQQKRTNLNAQEIGDDAKRAADWARMHPGKDLKNADASDIPGAHNPVFDVEEVRNMVKDGLAKLTAMQCADGGWGWFSGYGEYSYPHTTAYVVHGLQIAKENDAAIVPGVLDRGVAWLKNYQAEQLGYLRLPQGDPHHKDKADNLDAFVYMVLVNAGADNKEMQDYLYRDRNDLAVYAKAMFGLALEKLGVKERLAMIMTNIEQYLVQDDENQTAYLKLPGNNWWWCWYGSEYEAQGYYLKLLAKTDPKSEKASRLVKYLINNRKHATYWNSTRDTAVCVEAFVEYIQASGEDQPDMTVEVWLDGQKAKEVAINKDNLFSFDNKLVVEGKALTTGEHKVEIRRRGKGPVYFNAYLTNFTLEDLITKAGLEVKVNRKYYLLTRVPKTVKVEGAHGQALDEKVEKYQRTELGMNSKLRSGDLVEVEMEIDSKNDYEYLMFEDMKPAGFEPVEVRSGYNGNDMGAYVEFRDERVRFFVRALARGKHSVSYRMRAEVPGLFSALPTRASAMYAPELKANSDELKIGVVDQ